MAPGMRKSPRGLFYGIVILMVKEVLREDGGLSPDEFAVLYEAAQAENCFRGLDEPPECIQMRINRLHEQLDYELGKLAHRAVESSPAKQKKSIFRRNEKTKKNES